MSSEDPYDLLIVGCGGAALSTAVSYAETARAAGDEARIALLERSTEGERGASTRWTTAGMRVDENFVLDPEWIDEMQQASDGLVDLELCQALAKESPETGRFLTDHGVEFIHFKPLEWLGFHKDFSMPKGGGLSIIDNLARSLEEHPGVSIHYETEAASLLLDDDGRVSGVRVRKSNGSMSTMRAEAVMLACGGFEGNYEMLTQYLGKTAIDLKKLVPGTRFNTGDGIRMAQAVGAAPAGDYGGIHCENIDPRSEKPDTVIAGHNYCIAVDSEGKRFTDEGSKNTLDSFEAIAVDIWEKTGNRAFFITDEAVMSHERTGSSFETDVPPLKADTIGDLAAQIGMEPSVLEKTVEEFNAACTDIRWEPADYDGKSTAGLTPPKSNWANPIVQAPFYAFPVAAAICFTFGGLKTDTKSRVLSNSGFPIPGLYAAGEIAGLTYRSYPALTNVLRSCTFGRIAGAHAATTARNDRVH